MLPFSLPPMDDVCPMYQLLDLLGKKRTIFLIMVLCERESTFNMFLRKIPKISGKTLAERLDMLVDRKIVARTIISDKPLKIIYQLTSDGIVLAQKLIDIGLWQRSRS